MLHRKLRPCRTYIGFLLSLFLVTSSACSTSHPKKAKASSRRSTKKSRKRVSKSSVNKSRSSLQGLASWYGQYFHGRTTANGEKYDMYAMTAAHKTLPFNTKVRVIDTESGASVVVRINDRGPFKKGRVIDLSKAAAEKLGILDSGLTQVRLEIIP